MAPWPARALGAGVVVVLVVAGLAAGGVDRVRDGWDDFSSTGVVATTPQPGQRLTELGNNGRIEIWDVALQGGFEQRPWIGLGAGTYPLLWERDRPSYRNVFDGHSVYLETLGEMGIVGMALLGIALVADARSAVVAGPARPGPGMGCARRRRDRVGGPCGRRLGLGDAGRHRVGVLRGRPRAGAAGVGDGAARGAGSDRAAAGHPRGRRVSRACARAAVDPALTGAVDRGAALLPRGRLHADDRPLGRVELGVERAAGAAGAHRVVRRAPRALRVGRRRSRGRGAARPAQLGAALHAGARAGRRGPGPAAGGPGGARAQPAASVRAGRGEAVHDARTVASGGSSPWRRSCRSEADRDASRAVCGGEGGRRRR